MGWRLNPATWLLAAMAVIGAAVPPVAAETITVAVEDKDYAPYYVWTDGEPSGPCVEIAAGAIREMGAEVEFLRFPWSRVLRSVEEQKVDAALCGTKTEERESYSYFPDEPVVVYDATLFAHVDSGLDSSDPSGLAGLSVALVKGYSYEGVEQALEDAGMIRVEAANRESLWNLIAIGRADTALDSILPMVADTRAMGISDQVKVLRPSLAETPGYLFFSRKPGHDELARRFSRALEDFKETPEFEEIKQRYGLTEGE